MGGLQSSLVKDGQLYVHVQSMSLFPRGGHGVDPTKPEGLAVDDSLYIELHDRLNPLAKQLNRGRLTGIVVLFVVLLTIVILSSIPSIASKSYSENDVPPIAIFVWLTLILSGAMELMFITRNQKIDEQILTKVVEELKPRFAAQGYDIQYFTQYTGFCKPKGAKVERVIVFFAASADNAEMEMAESDALRAPLSTLAPVALPTVDAPSPTRLSIADQMMGELNRPM